MTRWHWLQMAILMAVAFSNIYWKWTPNSYLVSIIGVGVAWLVTITVVKVADLARR